jgi:hypothetical protein
MCVLRVSFSCLYLSLFLSLSLSRFLSLSPSSLRALFTTPPSSFYTSQKRGDIPSTECAPAYDLCVACVREAEREMLLYNLVLFRGDTHFLFGFLIVTSI